MAFDRSKFKATQVSTLKEQEVAAKPANQNEDGKVSFHKIEEGQSKWRLMPAHPESKSFLQAKQVHWLPQEVTYKNREGKEVTEIKRRPVFNSRTHAGTSKDIIEEYISFINKIVFDEIQDPEARKAKLFNLTNWKVGVRGRTTWIAYAQKIEGNAKTLGRLELPGLVRDKMNELAITEDQSDAVIQTDPFTDPDTGKAILITYDKSQKEPVKKYATTLEWRGDYSLSDADLEELMAADSLEKIYKGSYRRKDFEKALEGLRIFDEENEYGAFGHDEWLDICEKIDKFYAEPEEEVTAESIAAVPVKEDLGKGDEGKTAEEDEVEEEEEEEDTDTASKSDLPWEDEYDEMDRDGLKKFIKSNKLEIRVLKKYTDDDLRKLIREEMEEVTNPANEAPKEEVVSDKPAGGRAAAMRDRLAKKNA